jgi:hypothetical protein
MKTLGKAFLIVCIWIMAIPGALVALLFKARNRYWAMGVERG